MTIYSLDVVLFLFGTSLLFQIGKGVRQGCIASPNLFSVYAERIMHTALNNYVGGVTIGGESMSNLRYADDTTLLANTKEELQQLIERVRVAIEEASLFLNVKKMKVMVIGEDQNPGIVVGREMIEVAED